MDGELWFELPPGSTSCREVITKRSVNLSRQNISLSIDVQKPHLHERIYPGSTDPR